MSQKLLSMLSHSGASTILSGPASIRAPRVNRSLLPRPAHRAPSFIENGMFEFVVSKYSGGMNSALNSHAPGRVSFKDDADLSRYPLRRGPPSSSLVRMLSAPSP